MSNNRKNKLKFEEVQNQIGNLKNIGNEFGDAKDKALDLESHRAIMAEKGTELKDKIMSVFKGVVSIAVLGILAQMLFPWWTIAIVGFWVGYWLGDTPSRSFSYGFLSMSLVWSLYAVYQSTANGGLMTGTISGMLGGTVSGTQLIYVTGLIGGLITGFATTAGSLLRPLIKKEAKG